MSFEEWCNRKGWDHYIGFALGDVEEAWEAGYNQAKEEEEYDRENDKSN